MTDASPNTALTVHEGTAPAPKPRIMAGARPLAIVPEDLDQAYRIANLIHRSGLAPYSFKTPEAVMVAILHGLEVGLTPMNALQSIAIINGKPTIYGDGAIGLVQSSGQLDDQDEHFEGVEGTDGFRAVCALKRKGKARPFFAEFSVADAKTAGLWTKRGKNGEPSSWQTYPKRMLRARALGFALRAGFADVLKGLSIREEQADVVLSQHTEHEPELPLNAVPDRVPSPPPEDEPETSAPEPVTETEVIDQTTGEVTSQPAEAVKADPISSGLMPADNNGFPGDKPLNKPVAKPNGNGDDIPWAIDRKLSDNDREWLRELAEEFGQCADLESIASIAESIMDPVQEVVTPHAWKKACDLMDTHIERVNG